MRIDVRILRRTQYSAEENRIRIFVDGEPIRAIAGETVATALLANGFTVFRISPRKQAPRAPFCFMGACQECVVRIDGHLMQSCMTPVKGGMRIERLMSEQSGD